MTLTPASRFVWIMLIFALTLSACASQPQPTPTATVSPVPSRPALRVLTVMHPQAPSTFNLYLTDSIKDFEVGRVVYEPLAAFDQNGKLIPILAREIPSLENGGLAEDGKSVTWKLRQGVLWSDGTPFTADDVAFTFSFIIDPKVGSSKESTYHPVESVEALDDWTVKVTFKEFTPAWYLPFVGNRGVILPRHAFAAYKGENARQAPANTMPIGTGAYIVKEPGIKPQEVLLLGSQIVQTVKIVFLPNPNYRDPQKISFDRIVWLGGGTPQEGARLSLQFAGLPGGADLAYDLESVDVDTLDSLSKEGSGQLVANFAPGVERLLLNQTDPRRPSETGEYSSLAMPHPLLGDKTFRQAIAYAINREAIAALYGVNGLPAYAILVSPPQYRSPQVFYQYDPVTANALLDEAKFLDTDGDGIREYEGADIKLTFQSYVGAIAQQSQELIKKDLQAIGLDVDLRISKNMFDPGATNPESVSRFPADLMMFRTRSGSPDPTVFMKYWTCDAIPQESNGWKGNNYERWCNKGYDNLLNQIAAELDEQKRVEAFITLNDMLAEDAALIPLVWRASALGVNKNLTGIAPTPWDSVTWNIQDWQLTAP